MRGASWKPAVLALLGLAIAIAWTLVVLPAASFSAGVVPGKDVLFFGLLVAPPAAASSLLVVGGIAGLRSRRTIGSSLLQPGSLAFLLAAILGIASAAYTLLLILILAGITHL